MLDSLRCGAKTRAGEPCRSPAVKDKARCRMHGGAVGSGAPKGNRNALKTGLHTQDVIGRRKAVNALLKRSRAMLDGIE
jgi:hypothetical protein